MPGLSIIDRDPLSARVIFAIALLLGAFMRFFRLGMVELSGDEAVSWAAAAAPSLSATIATQHELNPGKLALHDLTLHAWIGVFGDSEAALRGLSALFGVACIALVFFVARELMARLSRAAADSTPPGGADSVAATSALIAAVSFPMVRESREARMYAMMLALMLAQVGFFLRAERRGGAANQAAVAIFTALGVAANFTALLVIGVEAAWIGYRAAQRMRSGSGADANSLWALCAAIAAGLLMLAPFTIGFRAGLRGARRGAFAWIAPPGPFAPVHVFEAASGTFVFPILAALAAWGALRFWRSAPEAVRFALLWMWLPPIALLAGSYLFAPMFVTRYLASSFVAFFVLAALGIVSLKPRALGLAALSAVVILSVARVGSYYRKPHDEQWREAATLASARAEPGGALGVVNYDYEGYAVGYYIRRMRSPLKIVRLAAWLDSTGPDSIRVAIVPRYLPRASVARFERAYPRTLGRFRGVEVIARSDRDSDSRNNSSR